MLQLLCMNKLATIYDCKMIEFPIENSNGLLYHLDLFEVKRLFYIYNVKEDITRGNHAHLACKQVLIAASGKFNVLLDDGIDRKIVSLDSSLKGLYIPAGIWVSVTDFSADAICLVLASHIYEDLDYIRDYTTFLHYRGLTDNII